jgi:glycosidase
MTVMLKPPEWVKDAIFYQIFPDRFKNGDPGNDPPDTRPWGDHPDRKSFFGGDLYGIIESLDYLEELGVNALYLNPIFTAPSNHKYDIADYFEVDPHLGGNGALLALVEAAHRRGIRVILDGIFNHCGDEHPFFQDVLRRGQASPYWDWFMIHGEGVIQEPVPNYDCWAGVKTLPEWNHKNPAVREYLLSVVRHWLSEYEIDGWRLDAVEHISPDFVREIRDAAKSVNPEAYILGEVMGLAAAWFKYGALDGVMNYRLWEGLVYFIAWESWDAAQFRAYAKGLWGSYPPENFFACYNLIGSHDKPRIFTLCEGDRRKVALIVATIFSLPGAPAIYYGDEVGLEGGEDPDCRRCFPWDRGQWDEELRELFRTLIRIRKEEPTLRRGDVKFGDAKGRAFFLEREFAGEKLFFFLNAGEETASFHLACPASDLLSGERHRGEIRLPPKSFAFLKEG